MKLTLDLPNELKTLGISEALVKLEGADNFKTLCEKILTEGILSRHPLFSVAMERNCIVELTETAQGLQNIKIPMK